MDNELYDYINGFGKFFEGEKNINNIDINKIEKMVNKNKENLLKPNYLNARPLHNYLRSGGCNPKIIKLLVDKNKKVLDLQDGIVNKETPLVIYLRNVVWKKHNRTNPESDENIRNVLSLLVTEKNIGKLEGQKETPFMIADGYIDSKILDQYLVDKKVQNNKGIKIFERRKRNYNMKEKINIISSINDSIDNNLMATRVSFFDK